MIIPLVDDAVWQSQLAELPTWQPPAVPTLVLAPHPDDETLGAGALIAALRARGIPVTVVAATDGENCYDLPPQERTALGKLREQEQADALSRLGVSAADLHRLHLTDSGLHLLEAELTTALMTIARPGMHLIAPWSGDFHPDHEACARAAQTVAQAMDLPLTSYFFWTWHRGEAGVLNGMPVRRFVPNAAAMQAKAAALACHHSQLVCTTGDPILPSYLLGPAAWPFEVFLPA
ncbi:MAG: PIG-L deacetylase family protein [Janthinobacterium lividum]